MKLKDLHEDSVEELRRKWTPKEMPDDEIIEWCNQHASAFLNKKIPIFRGTVGKSGLLNTMNLNRPSANTNGYYNWWIDNAPEWADYPKRSKSIIGATDFKIADGYGEVFLIIPEDTAKVGMCPRSDMWHSFKGISKSEFNDMDKFLEYVSRTLVGGPASNWEQLKRRLENTGLEAIDRPDLAYDMELRGVDNLLDYFEDVFDPNRNHFHAFKASEMMDEKGREVWVSGNLLQLEMNSISPKVRKFLSQYYELWHVD